MQTVASLYEERAYILFSLAQFNKLSTAANADTALATVLRPALMQEVLRACLCDDKALEPFVTTLPGETEPVLGAPYVHSLSHDGG
jgi:hypothetical protein